MSPAGGIVVVVVIVRDTWTQNTDPTKLIVSGHHSGELTRVEDLAGAESEVATLLEVLGHGHHLQTCRHCRHRHYSGPALPTSGKLPLNLSSLT